MRLELSRLRWAGGVSCVVASAFALSGQASAHQSGCHSNYSCPSDHHTYVWANNGMYWDCAATYAPEYDPSGDTTIFSFDGMTWGCRAAGTAPAPTPVPTATPVPTPTPTPSPAPIDTSPDCIAGRYADRDCTPGIVFKTATRAKVCTPAYTKRVRHVTTATKRKVFAEYGITPTPGAYEVDHLIPLELGGSNSIENLWPEPYDDPKGARRKDVQENALHRHVCSGALALKAAQRKMVKSWSR